MRADSVQRGVVERIVVRIAQDARVVGVAVTGSLAAGLGDEYSDVDLVLAVRDDAFEEVEAERLALIASWAPLIVGFTGEHVGEPRVIISVIGPPLVHVDLKFVRLSDFGASVIRPWLIHDPAGALAAAVVEHPGAEESVDAQWIEDRFWVWVHYAAAKLGRGELFEVIDMLALMRSAALGPLAAVRAGIDPRGVRRLESAAPRDSDELRATVSRHDRKEAGEALRAAVRLYRSWSRDIPFDRRTQAEDLAVQYLDDVIRRRRENG
ncbi:MAG: nucleotidyltransferase domain-containing protein [Herbiconiux sp.]|uniref:nucleotidyltransferase domain-containing protein n=1 Tax=Herbiconiux sp. TaxID=1871186 RepID=UPI00120C72D0|nr:nucleotidyltransferase domain-containing protein [Herbiconiux sp.]TAJ50169.1 MAG: nucleotidyltransferase domain-containing protein [Herbiconiux sp.]